MKDSQKAPISAIFGVWLIILVIIFGGAQCGCSAAGDADVTALEIVFDEPDAVEPPAPEVVEAPLPPAPSYFGGQMVEGFGLGKRDGRRAIPASRSVAWYAPADVEARAELVAAIDELAALSGWTFAEVAPEDAKLTFSLARGREVSEACSVPYGEGTCWLGSAKCLWQSGLSTGGDAYVCTDWQVRANVDAIETFAATRAGIELSALWRDFFVHEIGHTLGLNHAKGSIMASALPVYGIDGSPATFSACELARLGGFRPEPGSPLPLEVVASEACQ